MKELAGEIDPREHGFCGRNAGQGAVQGVDKDLPMIAPIMAKAA